MDEKMIDEFDFTIDPVQPIFVISVVSIMVNIPIWTLRKLDDLGVVQPQRLGKKTRCYSKEQIKTLKFVYYLMTVKKVNISGIKYFLEVDEGRQREI